MDMFSALLAVCFIILLYRKCAVMRIIAYIQKMGAVTRPEKGKVGLNAKDSALGSLFWYVEKICFYCISIMLF